MRKRKQEKCLCCFEVNPDPRGRAQAYAAARRALRRMKSSGWSIRVSHNINWYWNLQRKAIQVIPAGGEDKRFWAMMDSTNEGTGGAIMQCGNVSWTPENEYFADPNKAAESVFNQAKAFKNAIVRLIAENELVAQATPLTEGKNGDEA